MQDPFVTSSAWPIPYEMVASTSGAIERRAPSSSELALIRSLRDQLKNTQHQLKVVTAKVALLCRRHRWLQTPRSFCLRKSRTWGKP
jgi:hypothetical protein